MIGIKPKQQEREVRILKSFLIAPNRYLTVKGQKVERKAMKGIKKSVLVQMGKFKTLQAQEGSSEFIKAKKGILFFLKKIYERKCFFHCFDLEFITVWRNLACCRCATVISQQVPFVMRFNAACHFHSAKRNNVMIHITIVYRSTIAWIRLYSL